MFGSEAQTRRLEALWSGDFGDAYIERNRHAGAGREPFWSALLAAHPVRRVLEVGCNVGANLRWLAGMAAPVDVCGVDINEKALALLKEQLPQVHAVHASARRLPFQNGWFDLVFTAGVLIHLPEEALPIVMGEVVRCSRRYVLCSEYFSEKVEEIFYRGQRGALFKRDYGRLYQERFPDLRLLRTGQLTREQGWDDVTFWLFERSPHPGAHQEGKEGPRS